MWKLCFQLISFFIGKEDDITNYVLYKMCLASDKSLNKHCLIVRIKWPKLYENVLSMCVTNSSVTRFIVTWLFFSFIFSIRREVRHYYLHLTDVETEAASRGGTCLLVAGRTEGINLSPSLQITNDLSIILHKKRANERLLNNFAATEHRFLV